MKRYWRTWSISSLSRILFLALVESQSKILSQRLSDVDHAPTIVKLRHPDNRIQGIVEKMRINLSRKCPQLVTPCVLLLPRTCCMRWSIWSNMALKAWARSTNSGDPLAAALTWASPDPILKMMVWRSRKGLIHKRRTKPSPIKHMIKASNPRPMKEYRSCDWSIWSPFKWSYSNQGPITIWNRNLIDKILPSPFA